MATHSSIFASRIPMDRGAWQAIVHGIAKSWTSLPQALQQSSQPITLALTLSASASFSDALQAHWQLRQDDDY